MRNESFYTKIPLRGEDKFRPFITKSNWWKFVLVITLIILLGPFIPGRHVKKDFPSTGQEYIEQLTTIFWIVIILLVIVSWSVVIKPYINYKRGYNFRGQFEVVDKTEFLGIREVGLKPGTNHRIKVGQQSFKSLKKGDKVLIERRALGDLVKIKKI